jgi:hypothetical protein
MIKVTALPARNRCSTRVGEISRAAVAEIVIMTVVFQPVHVVASREAEVRAETAGDGIPGLNHRDVPVVIDRDREADKEEALDPDQIFGIHENDLLLLLLHHLVVAEDENTLPDPGQTFETNRLIEIAPNRLHWSEKHRLKVLRLRQNYQSSQSQNPFLWSGKWL